MRPTPHSLDDGEEAIAEHFGLAVDKKNTAAALHWAEIAVVVIAEATQEALEGSVEEFAVAIRLA